MTRDLTERRRAEAERRRRAEAQEAVRLRDEFLSVASHELKTPLTALRGMTQLTLRRYARDGDVAPERVAAALRLIDTQAGKLARLVEQLLDLSRLEAGHLMLERRETDLGALAATVAELFRAPATATASAWRCRGAPSGPRPTPSGWSRCSPTCSTTR